MFNNTPMANIGRFKVDKDCGTIISEVQAFLVENTEWISRYAEYAEKIKDNLEKIKLSKEKRFHEWAPLYLYMNVAAAKGQGIFSLRYLGQDVAKLKVALGKITISTKGFEAKNKRDFRCNVTLEGIDWRSESAAKFRKYFSNHPKSTGDGGKGNEEHRIESMFLTEFAKNIGKDKILCNIQPVKFAGIARFQMPTPLSACDINNIKFVGAAGGGIDIMARIGKSGATKLCIMELKDQNIPKEPPSKVVKQGLAYALFIRELLKSDSGAVWWKIFGFSGKLPEQLELYVTCVMPSSVKNNDTSFKEKIIKTGKDSFNLNYIYFEEEDHKVTGIETSLKRCIVKTH